MTLTVGERMLNKELAKRTAERDQLLVEIRATLDKKDVTLSEILTRLTDIERLIGSVLAILRGET